MKQPFIYSFKVWLTTICLALVVYALVLSIVDREGLDNVLGMSFYWLEAFLMYIMLFMGITLIPFLIYWLALWLLHRYYKAFTCSSWLPTLLGELLVILSFIVLITLGGDNLSLPTVVMLISFVVALGVSTRFYIPKATTTFTHLSL